MFRSLTVGAGVALSAGTLVLVRPRVDARPSVQAWLMSAAEIQIFVAKMAAPVGVAEALPGLAAGAVYAAGVGDALVTVLTLPTIQTLALSRLLA